MTFLRRIFDMIGIKRAAQGARDEFRKAARELQSAVADADETVTRIQMRSDDPKTQPMIRPLRRFSDQRN
jgi:hypothetical protein